MPDKFPAIIATLDVPPDYSGRVMVYVENGKAINSLPLLDGEHVGSLACFLDLARLAGYIVQSPEQAIEANHAA